MKDIITVEGKGSLYKILSNNKQGFIVEDIVSKERSQIFARQNISLLSEIQIYTEEDSVELQVVFKTIETKEQGEAALTSKPSAEELKRYFAEIVPDYDRDRVYVSDMKKVVKWYNLLQSSGNLKFESEEKTEGQAEGQAEEQA